ncbi:MAG: TMF family protein, partial [Bacteroidota bacterium]|nr:TMF family protein [Bacteroidota bacterium]
VNTGWCDYVFEEGYNLMPLYEVEKYINTNKHLPDVPSAAEVEKNGIEVGEMNATLLRKIEELTLHMIELKKENDALKSRLDNLTIQASQK